MVDQFSKPKPKIEPIESIEARRPVEKLENTQDVAAPEKIKFDQALEKMDPAKANIELRKTQIETEKAAPQSLSPFDVAKTTGTSRIQPPSPETIKASALSIRAKLDAPNATLISYQEKDVDIPKQYMPQLNAHIEHVDKSLVDATSTITGVEVQATATPSSTSASPPMRFLHYLTDSDKRLDTIIADVTKATSGGHRLTPEKLMAVQIKLNFASQELEFFTNVLNRSVETVKTLMNVQI